MANQLYDVVWLVMPKVTVGDGLALRVVDSTLKRVVRNHTTKLSCTKLGFALKFPYLRELHFQIPETEEEDPCDMSGLIGLQRLTLICGESLYGLTMLSSLESLDLRACCLRGDQFEAVSRIGTLRHLRITSANVDLGFLSGMTQLRRLVLYDCCALGGPVDLSGLVCLQELKINFAEQVDVASIERLPALRRVKLWGIQDPEDMLGRMTQLQCLTARTGLPLSNLTGLTKLSLLYGGLSAVLDFSRFKHIVCLKLRNVYVPLDAIKHLSSLKEVSFMQTACDLTCLPATVQRLTLLDLMWEIRGELSTLTDLQYLRVQTSHFLDKNLVAFSKVRSLRTLVMIYCKALSRASIRTLQRMTQLRCLALDNCWEMVTGGNIMSLTKMKWLSELGIGDSPKRQYAALRACMPGTVVDPSVGETNWAGLRLCAFVTIGPLPRLIDLYCLQQFHRDV
jgi:hypothetical protein